MSQTVYLDHPATSFPKAPTVVAAMSRFLGQESGNPGRGGHRLSVAASRAIEAARESIASLLGGDPERTLLGSSATFWLNTLIQGLVPPGGRVVCSALEHNAVMRPLRELEARAGVTVAVVGGGADNGVPSADEIAAEVARRPTSLVVLSHASNVCGAVLPVAAIARTVAPVPVVVDGAQSAGSLPLDFAELGVAAFACSGHKGLLGPPGTGVLLLAPEVNLQPLVRGGTGSHSEHETMPNFLPDALEAGTPNGVGIVGLGAACDWLAEQTLEQVHQTANALARIAAAELSAIPEAALLGYDPSAPRIAVLSLTLRGHDSGELAARLDREHSIALRAGLHCAPAAHRRLGSFPDGALRIGFGPFNTTRDVERLIEAVRECI